MNKCYICNTPFQLLNAINHYYHNKVGSADLYIGNNFYNCNQIATLLSQEHLFSNIYIYDFPNYKRDIISIIQRASDFFSVNRVLKKWTHGEDIFKKIYDELYISIYTPFSIAVRQINPNAHIIFFDDGIGTYTGNAQNIDYKRRRLIYKMFKKEFPNLNYEILYLNNVEFYNSINKASNKAIKQLPKINNSEEDFLNLLNKIFAVDKQNLYNNRRIIYLTQPNYNSKNEYQLIENVILNQLAKYKEYVILRIHPRQFEYNFGDFLRDEKRTLWELIVLNNITDNHILVSIFSTAQFVPKVMYGIEPTVVFTYMLYKNLFTSEEIKRMSYVITKLTELYIDKSKIIIPHNFESFSNTLMKLGY